jgi:hypothetical protein
VSDLYSWIARWQDLLILRTDMLRLRAELEATKGTYLKGNYIGHELFGEVVNALIGITDSLH